MLYLYVTAVTLHFWTFAVTSGRVCHHFGGVERDDYFKGLAKKNELGTNNVSSAWQAG